MSEVTNTNTRYSLTIKGIIWLESKQKEFQLNKRLLEIQDNQSSVNNRMLNTNKLIAFVTGVAALYYLLEIIKMFYPKFPVW